MKKTDKNYKYRDIVTATDCAIAKNTEIRYNDSMIKQKNKTFNVCYLREYMDPECQVDYFEAYETIYRNVPEKYKDYFNTESMKMKILKFVTGTIKILLLTLIMYQELNLLTTINIIPLSLMCLVTLCKNTN